MVTINRFEMSQADYDSLMNAIATLDSWIEKFEYGIDEENAIEFLTDESGDVRFDIRDLADAYNFLSDLATVSDRVVVDYD